MSVKTPNVSIFALTQWVATIACVLMIICSIKMDTTVQTYLVSRPISCAYILYILHIFKTHYTGASKFSPHVTVGIVGE